MAGFYQYLNTVIFDAIKNDPKQWCSSWEEDEGPGDRNDTMSSIQESPVDVSCSDSASCSPDSDPMLEGVGSSQKAGFNILLYTSLALAIITFLTLVLVADITFTAYFGSRYHHSNDTSINVSTHSLVTATCAVTTVFLTCAVESVLPVRSKIFNSSKPKSASQLKYNDSVRSSSKLLQASLSVMLLTSCLPIAGTVEYNASSDLKLDICSRDQEPKLEQCIGLSPPPPVEDKFFCKAVKKMFTAFPIVQIPSFFPVLFIHITTEDYRPVSSLSKPRFDSAVAWVTTYVLYTSFTPAGLLGFVSIYLLSLSANFSFRPFLKAARQIVRLLKVARRQLRLFGNTLKRCAGRALECAYEDLKLGTDQAKEVFERIYVPFWVSVTGYFLKSAYFFLWLVKLLFSYMVSASSQFMHYVKALVSHQDAPNTRFHSQTSTEVVDAASQPCCSNESFREEVCTSHSNSGASPEGTNTSHTPDSDNASPEGVSPPALEDVNTDEAPPEAVDLAETPSTNETSPKATNHNTGGVLPERFQPPNSYGAGSADSNGEGLNNTVYILPELDAIAAPGDVMTSYMSQVGYNNSPIVTSRNSNVFFQYYTPKYSAEARKIVYQPTFRYDSLPPLPSARTGSVSTYVCIDIQQLSLVFNTRSQPYSNKVTLVEHCHIKNECFDDLLYGPG